MDTSRDDSRLASQLLLHLTLLLAAGSHVTGGFGGRVGVEKRRLFVSPYITEEATTTLEQNSPFVAPRFIKHPARKVATTI